MAKKILACLVCAAAILSLAGCGNEGTSPLTGASSSTQSPSENVITSSTAGLAESSEQSAPEQSVPEESMSKEDAAWAKIPYAEEGFFEVEDVDGGVRITRYNGYSEKVKIPEKIGGKDVVELASSVFSYSPSLQDVKVPKSVRRIEPGAFTLIKVNDYGAYPSPTPYLKKKKAENSMFIINDILFDGTACKGEVTIPEGIRAIGDGAFSGADITGFTFPDSVTEIGSGAFAGTPWLQELKSEKNLIIVNNILVDVVQIGLDDVIVPDGVTKIAPHAFEKCDEITSVTLPDSLVAIGKGAFKNCTALKSVNIPSSVTSIGDEAFCYCSSLSEITIPDKVSWIGDSVFLQCTSLKSIVIPNGVPSIGFDAFDGCKSLETVTLPEGLTVIKGYAFKGCNNLKTVNIPDSVTELKTIYSDGPFLHCTALTNATYKGKTYDYAHMENLVDMVNLGENGMLIENGILTKASKLRGIKDWVIPDGVIKIDDKVFQKNTDVTSVTLPDSIANIGNDAFVGCKNLKSINIPDGVMWIGSSAFKGCGSLTSIVLPDSVYSIDNYAFENCDKLESITVPGSVSQIGMGAFSKCTNVKNITISGSISLSTYNRLFQSGGNFKNIETVVYKGRTYDKAHLDDLRDIIRG